MNQAVMLINCYLYGATAVMLLVLVLIVYLRGQMNHFPNPSIEEQNRITTILDRFDTLCNDLTKGLPAEIEARQKQYEYYRDKLLTFKELGA